MADFKYLLDAGWVFLAAWSAVVIFVSLKAFGTELFGAQRHSQTGVRKPADSRHH